MVSGEAEAQFVALPTGKEWREDTREDILALVRAAVWNDVLRIARLRRLRVEFAADAPAFIARVEATEPRAVLIDTGATLSIVQMQRFVRSLWPATRILAIAPLWSEADTEVRRDADAVLRLPIRDDEWLATLVRAVPRD
jgi:hypothetical protein